MRSLKEIVVVTSSFIALAAAAPGEAAAQPPPDGSKGLVDELVVTARRREERVQDAPASVTSLSADSLARRGIDSPTELGQVTPGLNIVASGAFSQPVVRGVSSTNVLVGDEANVSIYVDGVYMSQMSSNFFKFNNVARVEVLKGPQGTLFGRNATGGAITVITKTPSFEPTGDFAFGVGSFQSTDASAYYSTGLTDTVAVDIAMLYHNDEGYVHDLIRGGNVGYEEFFGMRGKLLWKPTDAATITVSADGAKSDNVTTLSSAALDGNTRGRVLNPATPLPTGPYQYLLTTRPMDRVTQGGASLRGEFDLGPVNLMTLTAYRKDKIKPITDTDGSLVDISRSNSRSPSDTYSQEIQLSSQPGGRLQWVAGVYGFKNTTSYDPLISYPSGAIVLSEVRTKAYAAFGEGTYNLTDQLSATVGLRYSYEYKRNFGSLSGGPRRDFHASWDDWTPRVVVKYEIPETLNLYASYSKGFKSGQFNSASLSGVSVDPEHIAAYEVGAKTLMPGNWRASVAAYRYDYKDIQISSRVAGSTVAQLNNAAAAVLKGAELNIDGKVDPHITVGLGVSYIDGKYTRFPNANVTIPATTVNPTPATTCVEGTGPRIGGNRQLICDVSGNAIIRTPKWTLNASVRYEHELLDGQFDATANLFVSDKFYWDPLNRIAQPHYTVLNGQVAWRAPGGRYRFVIWGENLTDQLYELVVSTSANADWVNYAKPRSGGVRVEYSF
jgi:iron complex outermembrane receptor protein